MQDIVASVENVKFDIEIALEQQLGALPLPFPGMDKSGAAICIFHVTSSCSKGVSCPFRHVRGDRAIVCKHWLRGLCKKGDDCEFLHEYDMTKMPECYFYSRNGECSNKECPFLHIDPESKIKDCPWYDRGFCRHGPNCKNRHVRRVLCINYLCGFCLDGSNCKYQHPKWDIPLPDDDKFKKKQVICHHCGEPGHKITQCFKLQNAQGQGQQPQQFQPRIISTLGQPQAPTTVPQIQPQMQQDGQMRPRQPYNPYFRPRQPQSGPFVRRELSEVTCFKCGQKGHYANKCPKGVLAFLSKPAEEQPQVQAQQ